MRVGVTGASGFVGRAVVRRLLAASHPVVALSRDPSSPALTGVPVIRGDVRDAAALDELAGSCDAVVHAAAWVHRRAAKRGDRAECFAVNEGGTRSLLEALEKKGGPATLVHVSTTAVYGASHAGVAEDAPTRPETTYGQSKLAAERWVLDASRRGSIVACVLRPAVVFGVRAPGNTGRLLGLVRRGLVPRVAGASNRKSMVHVDDLAETVLRAIVRPGVASGRVYNVAAPPVTVREVVEALAEGSGARVRWVPVPEALAGLAAVLSRAASRATGGRIPDVGQAINAFMGESTVDCRAVERDLGLDFRPTAATLREMAREMSSGAPV